MKIQTLASGSKGNSYFIEGGLLLDCGISFKRIKDAIDINKVKACLVTHEHGDHIKATKQLLKNNIPCFMSKGTSEKVEANNNLKIITALQQFQIDDFTILPFDVQHDANEPLGFLIQKGNKKLLYATDTYYIEYLFKDLTHILIECNYQIDLLNDNVMRGIIHPARRKRTLSSHFELENVKQFFKANDLSKVEEIHLIHISEDNGNKEYFKTEIEKVTGKKVFV